jgi:hypothetical protein
MSEVYRGEEFSNVLQYATDMIENPPYSSATDDYTAYEHHVGTWATTMIVKHFVDTYLITPEKRDSNTNKKPDITIEIVEYDQDESGLSAITTKLHVVCEFKKVKGHVFEKILKQMSDSIYQTADFTGDYEVFAIAQRGLDIGFFEYFNYKSMLDEEGIENFDGFVPITLESDKLIVQKSEDQELRDSVDKLLERMSSEKREKMKRLVHRRVTKQNESTTEAQKVETLCIFNLKEHEEEIDLIFHHMAHTLPRTCRD